MKHTVNAFKRVLIVFMSLLTFASAFVGCNVQPTAPMENTEYQEYAGVDMDSPISKFVVNNQSSYKIVIPTEANECEEYSASELQDFVKQATGVKIEIVSDKSVKLGDRCISLGNTSLYKESGLNTSNLNVDGFRIKTEGETVLIKGQRDAGTLFGVYDFLEKFLGIKFLTSEYTYVPSLKTVPLYEMDIKEIPSFETRFNHNKDARYNPSGVVRMRYSPNLVDGATGLNAKNAKYGGLGCEHVCEFHSYDTHCPASKYKAVHPEWYTEPGSEDAGRSQICLANGMTDDGEIDETMEESVLKTVIQSVKTLILDNPDGLYVPLAQNDSNNWSNREDDVRQRNLFGGVSGHMIVFANAVINAVEAWMADEGIERDIKYWMFAYGSSFAPPDQTAEKAYLAVPHEKLYISLAPLQDYWNVPLYDERNTRTYKDIPGWEAITDRFFVYDYAGNFNNTFLWSPILTVIKPNALYLKDIGVKHYVSEGGCYGYVNKLKIYVQSKIFWNVNRDVNELISEYNRYCFGEEAGKVLDEMVFFCDAHYYNVAFCGERFLKATLYDAGSPWQKSETTLNVNFVRQVESYVQQARALIEADETLTQKERNARLLNLNDAELMVDMMKYLHYDALWKTSNEEKQVFLQNFCDRVKKTPVFESKFGSKWDLMVTQEFAQYGIY